MKGTEAEGTKLKVKSYQVIKLEGKVQRHKGIKAQRQKAEGRRDKVKSYQVIKLEGKVQRHKGNTKAQGQKAEGTKLKVIRL